MNPLAPPSDAVFDREVTCVRKGTGFTGCTGYLHGYLHVTEPGAKGGERTPERNGSGGRTTESGSKPKLSPFPRNAPMEAGIGQELANLENGHGEI